ncbi:hypothetical protein Psch_03602 [Pelotomaculum schinkii]|uniref:Uncharacterized protein n=1 Tax=Pelotomaculum schinkii TaxID=78350 RepID=A0A4Y7R884_9FIRM|nr:hypothetical protein Psch_03602 [Pelotomaculum schinkii]
MTSTYSDNAFKQVHLCGLFPCRNGEGEVLVAAAYVPHKPAATQDALRKRTGEFITGGADPTAGSILDLSLQTRHLPEHLAVVEAFDGKAHRFR